jgi:hypothetical protein
MTTQNYANHARFVPMYHFVLSSLLVLTLIGSVVNLVQSFGDPERIYSASLIVVLTFCSCLLFYYCRTFPLKAQDRAIRAEENLRHFAMTGKLFDPRLTMSQIIALRFAPDEEFLELARKAADANMPAADIKRAVRNWRADNYRA